MKRIAILMCLVLVATMAFAGGDMAKEKGKTHKATVEVVSVDMEAKTLTFKTEKGEEKTAPVMGMALENYKSLKAGNKIVVTCEDNDKGEHQGIAKIEMAKAHHTATEK